MPAKKTSGGSRATDKTDKTNTKAGTWSGAEVRAAFLRYFEEHGHTPVPSSSLVPSNDPTVLLTTAGMQQMIPYFLGQEQPPAKRLTSAQKCFRTTDIDSVGDASHLTFFEMLGNFSVGEYFKRDAIAFAWELLTKVYGIDGTRLHPTVHPDDDGAPGYWEEITGIPAASITRLEDNWWGPPGASGPCGPDSEIYYDFGAEYGCGQADCAPGCDRCDRFLEIWNLVFMQYYQDTDGHRTPLKQRNIDTGCGLERLSVVLQGVHSIYDTDLFRTIIDKFAALANTKYGQNPEHDRALRVIADHGRALVFLAADGVRPGNEGRNYVFRRVLRRAVRYGKMLGLEGPFLAEAASTVIDAMSGHYTELEARRAQIIEVLSVEERKFSETLATGEGILGRHLKELQAQGKTEIPGKIAFQLYDTHGFPLELTEEIAHERGMTVDRAGYQTEMRRQQDQAREHTSAFTRDEEEEAWTGISKDLPQVVFTGYEGTTGTSEVLAILTDDRPADEISAPQSAAIVLARTPFYAEAGGQVGDTGVISGETGTFLVSDTRRPIPGLTVHYGQMSEGHLRVGSAVQTDVDTDRRRAIMRNHSATHLLHRALRAILGPEVEQRGSLVAPDRLRFDFSFNRAMTPEELHEVDQQVNTWVLSDLPVSTAILPYKEALTTGAMALFSEKYGDMVRVVTMGPSRELCGGTHVQATGQIGLYLTTQEASTGAGVRRIEALTGTGAESYLRSRSDLVSALASHLQTRPEDLAGRVHQLQDELINIRRQLADLQRSQAREEAARLAANPIQVGDIPVVAAQVSAPDDAALRDLGDAVRSRLGAGVIVLATSYPERVSFIVTVDKASTSRLHAGKIATAFGQKLGGRGGGRPDSAQGGAKESDNLQAALASVPELLAATVG